MRQGTLPRIKNVRDSSRPLLRQSLEGRSGTKAERPALILSSSIAGGAKRKAAPAFLLTASPPAPIPGA
jgi:hypothetical protein